MLGVCERSLRRYVERYEEDSLQGLVDRRLPQVSQRRAPVDEEMTVVELYRRRYQGWNIRHFYSWYRGEHKGKRSYSWVKKELQGAGAFARAPENPLQEKLLTSL